MILGTGGHALSLLSYAKLCGLPLSGFASPNPPLANLPEHCPWLGDDDKVMKMNTDSVSLLNGIGSIASTNKRQKIYSKFHNKGYAFQSLFHPSAVIAKEVKLSDGIQVFPKVVIQPGAKIGENVLLNTGCIIEHDCMVGSHSHVAPGAVVSGGGGSRVWCSYWRLVSYNPRSSNW